MRLCPPSAERSKLSSPKAIFEILSELQGILIGESMPPLTSLSSSIVLREMSNRILCSPFISDLLESSGDCCVLFLVCSMSVAIFNCASSYFSSSSSRRVCSSSRREIFAMAISNFACISKRAVVSVFTAREDIDRWHSSSFSSELAEVDLDFRTRCDALTRVLKSSDFFRCSNLPSEACPSNLFGRCRLERGGRCRIQQLSSATASSK
mmetsp:Transcript_49173/g.141360  ORF Transcript_49173/g.141360 Transcript_49173/m.141360 type:complete len:209 (-) Transcript_49173:196-822(-)